jgi:hypothetical protein
MAMSWLPSTELSAKDWQKEYLKRMQRENPRFAGILERAYKGSKAAMINSFCLECMGWENDAVESIRHCSAPLCPLFNGRPYRDREKQKLSPERLKILRESASKMRQKQKDSPTHTRAAK